VGTICTTDFSHTPKHYYMLIPPLAMVQIVEPLRKCRDCGLEAWNEEDLKLFKKQKTSLYGRSNWCKKCCAKYTMNRYPSKRMKESLDNLEYPTYCYFCGEEITKFSGLNGDCVIIHSLDGNHNNWSADNKAPVHRRCHSRFHSPSKEPEVAKKISEALTGITRSAETRAKISASTRGSKSSNWKGDNVSDGAKYMREWRRKRREQNE